MADQGNDEQRFVDVEEDISVALSQPDHPFHGVTKIRFTNHIQSRLGQLYEFTSVDQVLLEDIERGKTKELKDVLHAFDHPLHGVVATGCSLKTVEWVYNCFPEIEAYDEDGHIPLHAALLYVRDAGDTFQWDVIRFLIEKHPGALTRRERLYRAEGMLPIHAFLDRYHLEPTGNTMYDEHLSLFLRPGYEHTLFEGFRGMYIPPAEDEDYFDAGPTYAPQAFREGHPVTFSFIKHQARYTTQKLSCYRTLLWANWLAVCVYEKAFGEATVPLEILRDILLLRIPREHNMILLGLFLQELESGDNELTKIMEECLSGASIPLSALVDSNGCTPLHNLRSLHCIYGHNVSFLVKVFPGILHHRNKAGLTAFQEHALETFRPQDDFGDFDVVYEVLRADPVGTLTESFRPMDTMLSKSSRPLESSIQNSLSPPRKKRRDP